MNSQQSASSPPCARNPFSLGHKLLPKCWVVLGNWYTASSTVFEEGTSMAATAITSAEFEKTITDNEIVFVDFWATWCGPCRMANKTMAPMKEELKDKDILYLYITGETSPLKTWENMIPDIHGEHFRLPDAQWKYLSDVFKIEGVPTYLIVDREGNTTFRQTGFPGVEKMKEELLKVTK